MDDGSDDDGESGEEGPEDPDSAPQAGFLSSTWSFIITFFMSLIPEGPPNAANWTTSWSARLSPHEEEDPARWMELFLLQRSVRVSHWAYVTTYLRLWAKTQQTGLSWKGLSRHMEFMFVQGRKKRFLRTVKWDLSLTASVAL